ncbi:MAG: hypothetical protein ACP5OG_05985 [Candidatus Nanoarchaeia archaeon]
MSKITIKVSEFESVTLTKEQEEIVLKIPEGNKLETVLFDPTNKIYFIILHLSNEKSIYNYKLFVGDFENLKKAEVLEWNVMRDGGTNKILYIFNEERNTLIINHNIVSKCPVNITNKGTFVIEKVY